jgi:hypothetical protein
MSYRRVDTCVEASEEEGVSGLLLARLRVPLRNELFVMLSPTSVSFLQHRFLRVRLPESNL